MPDIAIVGGGIIGAACAYELSRAGASVTLIERDELAAGASGRNQGWFVLPEDPRAGVDGSDATLPTYLEVAASAALPVWIDREPVGHLLVALESDDVPRAQHALTAATAQGVAIQRARRRRAARGRARDLRPTRWRAGSWTRGIAWIRRR